MGRWPSRVGLAFEETLSGAYTRPGAPDLHAPMVLTLAASVPSVIDLLASPRAEVRGELRAPGLVSAARVRGTLSPSPARGELATYRLAFEDDRGRPATLVATRRIAPRQAYASWTVLEGEVHDEALATVATCLLRFDARSDFGAWLKSLRLRWGPAATE